MGLGFLVSEHERLPQLNAVEVPAGVDEAAVRRLLLQDYGIEIGAGLGTLAGRIWRIGLMGYGSNPRNVRLVLGALDEVLASLGAPIRQGAALRALHRKPRA
jgi:alanine-glyoxylate transaminase/serine-glyoxylate transaminase/serine-pyruvate transaminase